MPRLGLLDLVVLVPLSLQFFHCDLARIQVVAHARQHSSPSQLYQMYVVPAEPRPSNRCVLHARAVLEALADMFSLLAPGLRTY